MAETDAGESDLSALIRKHRLVITPSGSNDEKWVAYNNSYAARGETPEEAVREAVERLSPKSVSETDKG